MCVGEGGKDGVGLEAWLLRPFGLTFIRSTPPPTPSPVLIFTPPALLPHAPIRPLQRVGKVSLKRFVVPLWCRPGLDTYAPVCRATRF